MKQEFKEALRLLRDLYDLQNGPPLIRYEKEFNKAMSEISNFLKQHEDDEPTGILSVPGSSQGVFGSH